MELFDHVTGDLCNIQFSNSNLANKVVTVANGKSLPIAHTGTSKKFLCTHSLQLNDILHNNQIKKNLLSIYKLCTNNNVSLCFDDWHVYVKDQRTSKEIVIDQARNGLYQLYLEEERQLDINSCVNVPLETWHHRFRHICENCTRNWSLLYSSTHTSASSPLNLVYADIWGAALQPLVNRVQYYVLFIDNYTKYN